MFFFFNDTATTEIYTLSLHDALPISPRLAGPRGRPGRGAVHGPRLRERPRRRVQEGEGRGQARPPRSEEPRLNSSHTVISYAVFCLKKKKKAKFAKNCPLLPNRLRPP